MKALSLVILQVVFFTCGIANADNRWEILKPGAIRWEAVSNLPHHDHIEMSGKYISVVLKYGVNDARNLSINRNLVFPMLRTLPNNTHASFIRACNLDIVSMLSIDKKAVMDEKVIDVVLDGMVHINSFLSQDVMLSRTIYPSVDKPLLCEKYSIMNKGDKPVYIEVPEFSAGIESDSTMGVDGSYKLLAWVMNSGPKRLESGETLNFFLIFYGSKSGTDMGFIEPEKELLKRQSFIDQISNKLILETPSEVLNNAFLFAKIRASESIFQTKGGPMHGPGGLAYYAAIWANDQAEYANPFFPFLGYDYGNESALNAFRHFARYMNGDYEPIPSSIIAEGDDFWNGAGDRGDAAMIAYGAGRFALTMGDKNIAQELWPLISWCLEYNKRKLNPYGVVSSDSDELEGRFPAGSANLCTSSMYYDALVSAVHLGRALGIDRKSIVSYQRQAELLKKDIEKYFGADVMGFKTYRYYDGNDILRSWICIPLTVGIFERKQGTVDALFSPLLWTKDGLATQSGDKTFWDRSTLYALRGVFAAGEIHKGLLYLNAYSNRRLLGDHVPYPVEAYPEGNQRHLSAESALYCRIFTEGLFGIRPLGFSAFQITPQLPDEWEYMRFKNVHGFNKVLDVDVARQEGKIRLKVFDKSKTFVNTLMDNGSSLIVELK